MSARGLAFLLIILCTLFWGIGGPAIKYSFQFVSPFEFLFWRFLLVSIISFPILIWYLRTNPLSVSELQKLLTLSFFGTFLNLALVFLGLERTTVVETAIIGSLQPMFVAVAGAIFLKESLTRSKLFGIILAISGTVVAVINPIINGGFGQGNFLGNLLVLLSILSWICFIMLSKKWESPKIKPFHITSFSFFVGLISFFILSSTVSGISQTLTFPTQAFPYIAYMAIFGSLLAFTLYEYALTKLEAAEVEIFGYLSPLWSIPIAILWLKEQFDPILIVSAILIITGIVIAERKERLKKHLRGHHFVHHK